MDQEFEDSLSDFLYNAKDKGTDPHEIIAALETMLDVFREENA